MEKTCKKCGNTKLVKEFYKYKPSKDGLARWCKSCLNASTMKWREQNANKITTYSAKASLKWRHGLTPEERQNIIKEQKGLCPICEKPLPKKVCIDHCHTTGKIRGVLCWPCNVVLGLIKDSPETARKAANYIECGGVEATGDKHVPKSRRIRREQTLLITGASGLVGHAVRELSSIKTTALQGRASCDLLRWSDVSRVFYEHKPTLVLHLAARVGGVQANMRSPATFFMENMTINTHVLEAARIHKVEKLVCALSTCVFPDQGPFPLKPEYLHFGAPHPSNYGYAFAKRMLEVQCRTYNEQHKTNFLPVIPTNIYGPHDNFNLENGHVVPSLIRKFYEAKRDGKPVIIWGSGKPLREFIYSYDVAKLMLQSLNSENNNPIILSTGQEYSVKQLVDTISGVMEFRGEIVYDDTKPDGQYRKPSDNSPLKKLCPDFNFTPLEVGIQETVAWFKANYPNVRGL